MIEKKLLKTVRSLERAKARRELGLFVAEGPKLVGELMATMRPRRVICTTDWHGRVPQGMPIDIVSNEELSRISLQQHPQEVLVLFDIPLYNTRAREVADTELVLALDSVQDPGNLGTIVRIADWFGIKHIFCSPTTADIFAPKAVQATMGALARVQVHYTDLAKELAEVNAPVYGTFLEGHNLYDSPLSPSGVIVLGNEGKGISPEVAACVTKRITIPPYPLDATTVESLNVGVATAIVCAEFRRVMQ